MKSKDIMFSLLAVVILLVAGYLAWTQVMPKKSASSNTVEVEVIGKIPSAMDSAGLAMIGDTAKVIDYNAVPDFAGLGNPAPFGR